MIDTSDGLSVDLLHLCEESGTGAEIDLEKLPFSPAIRTFEKKPERLALHGGEDYQLLFAVSPGKAGLIAGLSKRFRLQQIGRMTRGKGVQVVNERGEKRALAVKGYEHLR
jgi:thiamine-monophosphate kinase